MTFYPELGTFSREDFLSADGATFDSPLHQGITGGYVTLLSLQTGSSSVIRTWRDIPSWSLVDNLYSATSITTNFKVLTGQITGQVNTVSGSQGIAPNTSAWYVETSYPSAISGFGYTGHGGFGLLLGRDGPNGIITNFYNSGGQAITFEFDVSATVAYSGLEGLQGFTASGIDQSGLPALTGVVGHGVLFSNGTKWDYIEITPFGIRSMNHPEIAIPIDFLSPRRVRLGFRDSDLYLATEDGRTVVGYNKLDRALVNPPSGAFVIFGAPSPRMTYTYPNSIMSGVSSTYGYSLWDNIKILTGDMAIYTATGVEHRYSKSTVIMHTAPFNPGVSITKFLSATVGYVPYDGGTTTVAAQYSGKDGWTTFSTANIPATGNVKVMDLTSFPVFSYPRTDFGTDYLDNPIRFEIGQKSPRGDFLPPAIEYIEVVADKDRVHIDLLPDWKLISTPTTVKIGIESGTFLTDDPTPERWSSMLVNVPTVTGVVTGRAFADERFLLPVNIIGSGEVLLEGPYKSCLQNYTIGTLTAITGSSAYGIYGLTPTYNAYPNPLFAEGFRQVLSGEARFITGLTDGYLARDTRISSLYTGTHKVTYTQSTVYRPENQARSNRINSYLGRTSTLNEEFVQGVVVYPSPVNHNGTVGIEAVVPSGIATGNLLVSFDLEISKGTGVTLSLIGNTTGSYNLPGEFFRTYKPVSFFTTTNTNNEFVLRFNIPTGATGLAEYNYNIDNVTVSSFNRSYLSITGLSGALHTGGLYEDAYTTSTEVPIRKASTVVYGNIYIDSYPSESSGLFLKLVGQNASGLEINIDTGGFVNAIIDHRAMSWGGSSTTFLENLPRTFMTSRERIPLGVWTNIGFAHDVHTYEKFPFASFSGIDDLFNFSCTNRAVLTFNGHPVASRDLMTGWQSHINVNGDAAPYVSYIDLTGQVTAIIASGFPCKVDGIHILRPPVIDVETELSIKGARNTAPYFVPDSLYKGGDAANNYLYRGPINPAIGEDVYIGSCYNFAGPGNTHWDRGVLRNHLIYLGDGILKETICPYSGQSLNSTRFLSGSYAVAPYCSAYERLIGSNTQLALSIGMDDAPSALSISNSGELSVFGWIYPRTPGNFFTFIEGGQPALAKLQLSINTGRDVVVTKFDSSDLAVYSNTGHKVTLNEWSFVGLRFTQTGYLSIGTTGAVRSFINNGTSITSPTTESVGQNFGIRYQGRQGTTGQSDFRFGGTCDVNLFNWVIQIPITGETDYIRDYDSDQIKSGRYQAFLEDGVLFTGSVMYSGFHSGLVTLGASTEARDRYFAAALHNSYDSYPRLQGILAYDNKPFKEVSTYKLSYDTTVIANVFGATDSPIRVGNQVPDTAINVAKFTSPGYTVPSSVSVIDLSDRNINNLITYKNGQYQIGRSNVTNSSSLSSYKGINSGLYSGRVDLTISGQVISAEVEATTVGITDPSFDEGFEAYYYYLIGRGSRAVRILNAYPHYTGNLTEYTTGLIPDNYVANLEKIRSSIKLKNSAGEELPLESYPFSVTISPYTPKDLYKAVASGVSLGLDNVGIYHTGYILPDGIFSVILLTHLNKIQNDSVFVHYDAYNLASETDEDGYKEIVNPQPIFRERHYFEDKGVGKFDLELSLNNFYSMKVYGIQSGYSGLL